MIIHLKIVIQKALYGHNYTFFHLNLSRKPHKGTHFRADKRNFI
jgi:hypothetical protein